MFLSFTDRCPMLRVLIVQSLIVDQTHLVLVSGELVLRTKNHKLHILVWKAIEKEFCIMISIHDVGNSVAGMGSCLGYALFH